MKQSCKIIIYCVLSKENLIKNLEESILVKNQNIGIL